MQKRGFLILFLAAAAVRIAVAGHVFLDPAAANKFDSEHYLQLAQEAASGRFPSLFRTPVYPLFLALTSIVPGFPIQVSLAIQMLLDCAAAVMLSVIASRITTRGCVGLAAGLLWVFCPVAAALSTRVATESLFTFFAISAAYAGLSSRTGICVLVQGICWGAATLTRPSGVLLPVIVTGLVMMGPTMVKRRRLLQGGALGVYLTVVAGWTGFNYHRTGMATLSSVSDVGIYMYELSAVRMVDDVSWMRYVHLWLTDPRQGEQIRHGHEREFSREVNDLAGTNVTSLWETIEDPDAIRRFRQAADAELTGRSFERIGTHIVGAAQVLRPIPPWEFGGRLAFALDCFRLVLFFLSAVVLWRGRQFPLLVVLSAWVAYALLLPGICGMWRFRSMAEPAIALSIATAFAAWLLQFTWWRGLVRWTSATVATGAVSALTFR